MTLALIIVAILTSCAFISVAVDMIYNTSAKAYLFVKRGTPLLRKKQ